MEEDIRRIQRLENFKSALSQLEKAVVLSRGRTLSPFVYSIQRKDGRLKRNCNMKFGLKEEDIAAINRVFCRYASVEQVVIYGSRAKGNYRHGSDIVLT